MLPARRRGLILDHLRRVKAASIADIAELVNASQSTIRRDLEQLEAASYLQRTHGGALLASVGTTYEPPSNLLAQLARTEKQSIGREAATRIREGDSVIFDSSSTVRCAAEAALALGLRMTAITNDLETASLLAKSEGVHTVVPGGTVRPGSNTLQGSPGDTFLDTIHVDVALIGTHSIAAGRLSETSIETAAMKRAMIRAAHRIIVLADSSKFQQRSFSTICQVESVSEIITDDGLPPQTREELTNLGPIVTIVAS